MEGENRGPRRPDGERVLLFGGTFDPPHNGHIHFLKSAIEAAKPARVVVMPSCIPPHKAASATPAPRSTCRAGGQAATPQTCL